MHFVDEVVFAEKGDWLLVGDALRDSGRRLEPTEAGKMPALLLAATSQTLPRPSFRVLFSCHARVNENTAEDNKNYSYVFTQ